MSQHFLRPVEVVLQPKTQFQGLSSSMMILYGGVDNSYWKYFVMIGVGRLVLVKLGRLEILQQESLHESRYMEYNYSNGVMQYMLIEFEYALNMEHKASNDVGLKHFGGCNMRYSPIAFGWMSWEVMAHLVKLLSWSMTKHS